MKRTGDDRLDSWKEIAVFLERGVRTVQRWERCEGLPVHRHKHVKLGSVYAFRSEVAAWWESRRDLAAGSGEPVKAAPAERQRLLVLPFENLSGDPSQEYLAEGFTEELITQCARMDPERLAVIARATAMHSRQSGKTIAAIARELRADYVLDGSMRREGRQVRVQAQLIRANEQTHVWAETYDRDAGSMLALQSEVAAKIAKEIQVALLASPEETKGLQAGNPEAYDAYLRGLYHLNRMDPEHLPQAVKWLEAAVGADTGYALAYASLAHALAMMSMAPYDVMPPKESMPRARMAAERALALNPLLPEAHLALATVLHHYEWDWSGAGREYEKAIELNAEYAGARLRYAWLLLAQGRTGEALDQIARAEKVARETDPHLLVVIRATRAAAFYFSRDYDRCISECEDAMRLDPRYYLTHYLLARAEIRKGSIGKASQALMTDGESRAPLMQMAHGLVHAFRGETSKARSALQGLLASARQRYVPATYIGVLQAAIGDSEQAFEWLKRAYEERADGLALLNVDPMVDKIRSDPRFSDMVARLGLAGDAKAPR